MGHLGSSWLCPGSIPRVGVVSGACFPKILRGIGIAPGMRGFRGGKGRWKGRVSSCWLSRGWLGSCPGGLWPFPFLLFLVLGTEVVGLRSFSSVRSALLESSSFCFSRLPSIFLIISWWCWSSWGEAEVSERSVICSWTSFSSCWRWSITVR